MTPTQKTYPSTEVASDLAAELQRLIRGEVRFDGTSRMLYSTDASLYQVTPIGVVLPKDRDDVQAVVELAAKRGVPILPRGGGSSLAGQAVGASLVMDFSKHMDKVLGIDPEAQIVTAEAGVNLGALNRQLAALGWMIGPDPASAERATIGGSVGNNATGAHSILYGMMADHVVSTTVILADGSHSRFEGLDAEGVAVKAKLDSLEGRLYREIPTLVASNISEIVSRWPKHWRRASGYNLDRLAAALMPAEERGKLSFDSRFRPPACDPTRIDRFNLAQLITGSEGTLATITEATLRLVAKPKMTAVSVIHFERTLDACAAITDILECEPSASELLDKQVMDLARAQPQWAKKMGFVEGDPEAVLLTEFYGESEKELVQQMDRLESHLRARGWKGVIRRALDKKGQSDIWEVRKAGLNLLTSMRGDYKGIPGIEDVAVPAESLADYIGKLLHWCDGREAMLGMGVYAHASAGCLHTRPMINVKSKEGVAELQAMADFAVNLCLQYGGVMSGEHGDGYARSSLNPQLFGSTLYEALRQVKHVFDPQGIMNPGKIVDAPPLTQNLRMGSSYQTIELQTIFDWSEDNGFAGAIEMCNGAGVCRKVGAGTMCPSYMATKDEKDTTRARANGLRNALAGKWDSSLTTHPSHPMLYSEEMYDILDLCLGCKACKSECPSSVDMAKIKAEYLPHYYQRHGLPLFNRLMGWLPVIYEIGDWEIGEQLRDKAVSMANHLLTSSWFKPIQAKIGVHPERTLPTYAKQTLQRWFRSTRNSQSAPGGLPRNPQSEIILFHDTWTNFNEPHVGQAAVQVLETAGYTVRLAEGKKCCGRPLITGGQADQAKAWIDHNVALLAPFAAQGVPIVGIEPSCILTLRDEYLSLASDKRRAKLLASHAFTFEEFVEQESVQGRFQAVFKTNAGKALLHGHCHHKALVGNESTVAALKLAGYVVEVIPSGCCGMAGDFGYECDHYEVSRKIGEDRLFPAVRAADDKAVIVASGTSCRHQIEHFTERQAVHLVEALQRALLIR
ncbi:MAG: FAD-linked oxidase C-terminal domain-containing protein [Caldilineaceae bacterium]